MGAFDAPSSQESVIPAVDEGELEDLRWTTGVPCHMIDVFRANPFAAMDLPRITSTFPPSLGDSINPDSAECKIGGSRRARSAAKHILSPSTVEQKRKARAKRARIQSSPVVPFPATGPQEMFAYEFRLDIPYEGTGFSRAEEYRRCGDLLPSYSLSRDTNGREHLLVPQPVMPYSSDNPSLPLTVGRERAEHTMQPYLFPPSMHLTSRRLEDPSNLADAAPSQKLDGSRHWFDEYGCSSLPPPVPIRTLPERAQAGHTCPGLTPSMQRLLYACPLCPRDFQLPNGLALHLKWHNRVGNLTANSASHLNHHPQDRAPPKMPRPRSGALDARDMRLSQLPHHGHYQRGTITGLSSTAYTAPQRTRSAQAESVSK
jgi:hypothetical protein